MGLGFDIHWIRASQADVVFSEVDEAVNARENDPTGGRGFAGDIAGKLEKNDRKVIRSAV